MTYSTGMPRTRGGLSGLLLIVLGAWGALIPFVGPYFHYAYTPDRSWAYTSGRLWLEVVPGAATVLGGLIVLVTRSRLWGGFGALLAALGGAWFVVGAAVTAQIVKNGSIRPGVPVGTSAAAAASSLRQFLEGLGFFTGTGVLIVFFAALALGRFSVTSVAEAETGDDSLVGPAGAGGLAGQQLWTPQETPAASAEYPTAASQYPADAQPSPAGEAPPREDLFGRPAEQYPATGEFPAASATGQFPASSPPDPGENQF